MRKIATLILLTSLTLTVSAQRFVPRATLDSLARPTLSVKAEGVLSVDSKTKDLGEIDDSSPIRVSYTLCNEHSEAITITEIKASCSCLKIATKRATIEQGDSYTLTVEFNPAGRSGKFSYDINIYTTIDEQYPTLRLSLNGKISTSDAFSHLTEQMGALRLSRKSVVLEGVTSAAIRRERIAIANSGSHAIRPTARPTIEGLSLRCEPEVLEPGAEGDIIVEYRPKNEPMRDIETMLIIEGVEASPSQSILRITLKR